MIRNAGLILSSLCIFLLSCSGSKTSKLRCSLEEAPIIKETGTTKVGDFKKASIGFSRVTQDKTKLHVYLHVIAEDSSHLNGLEGDIMDITCSSIKRRYAIDTVTVTGFKVMNITDEVCAPVSLMFSIDRSGSMIQNAEKTRNAAISFVENKYLDDEIGVIVFGTWAKSESKITSNGEHLIRVLKEIDLKKFSGTNFSAGITKALNNVKMQAHYNDRGIILLSDGYGMSNSQANKIINRARNLGIAINFIQYKPFNMKLGKEVKIPDDGKLARRIASATGGIYKTVDGNSDFVKEFNDIRFKFCNVYKITIDKPATPGEYLYTFKFNDGCWQKGFELGVDYSYSDLSLFHMKNSGTWVYPGPVLKCDSSIVSEVLPDTTLTPDKEPKVGEIYLLYVLFDFDKSDLKEGSEEAINKVFKMLNAYPEMRIELRGHTDNRGYPDYNKQLSLDRCIAVKEALVQKGIAEDRIEVKGFGQSIPVADNDTPEGRALNRRTEFRVLNK